jgi:hypothetical protein
MQRKIITRLAVATLAAMTVAVPAATAKPIDPAAAGPRQTDMHASTVQKPKLDHRGEATKPESRALVLKPQPDSRGEATKPESRVPAPPPVGMPTWPVNPTPLTPPTPAPLVADGGNGVGDDGFPVVLIVIAGALALGGAMAATGLRLRARTHPAG